MALRPCDRCGIVPVTVMGSRPRFCRSCQSARFHDNGGTRAHSVVNAAVNRGELPAASSLQCADCGKPARDYDHRDYGKPLQVTAVCRSCNRQRGPARPVLTFELPGA